VAETWKPITGYQGYEVSDAGQVRSYRARNGQPLPSTPHIIKPAPTRRGYLTVGLGNGRGHTKTYKVHRLVLTAFIGPPPDGCVACHNNGCNTDNRLVNLRWDTAAANVRDTLRHGTHRHAGNGEDHPNAMLTNAQAAMAKTMLAGGMSARRISEAMGITRKLVQNIKNGRSYRHVPPASPQTHDAAIVELTQEFSR
jgi:hypothetical protein